MPRKKKSLADTSAKVMRRKKPINNDQLLDISPLTPTQDKVFEEWTKDKNLCLYGVAGTGKTFVALYLALKSVLDENTPYEKIYIVRSLVATREIGFLPGDHDDKAALYQIPYKNMVQYMFEMPSDSDFDILYDKLKEQETVSFWSTSFIRGTTLDNSIVIIDEMQNLNFHELDSIITRCGQDTKIIFSGDAVQSDLQKTNERNGILNFMSIIRNMEEFSCIEFNIQDIVRSGLVRSYLVAKIEAGF
jgi:predicted ribonuclease YlaK